MSLPIKYRPKTLDDIVGNEDVVEQLKLLKNRPKADMPHTFHFYGPSGCGKTTLGRIVAFDLLGCDEYSYTEVDAAQDTGIEYIREVRKNMRYKPTKGPVRVWLFDECHKTSQAAGEGFLKMLEEPPEFVYFILCTSEPEKLKVTFKRRGNVYNVAPVTDKEIMKLVKQVEKAENADPLSREVIKQIALDSTGSPGIALQILDEIIDLADSKRLEAVKRKSETTNQSIELCRALINGSSWNKVNSIISGLLKENPEQIRRAILGYCQSILLKEDNQQAYNIMEEMIELPIFNSGFPALTFACWRCCHTSEDE